MIELRTRPLNQTDFAPFGDVLDASGAPDKIINQGMCGRFHDRANLDFGPHGRAGISIFKAQLRSFPYTLDLVERHPEGSQAFVPMSQDPFLVIVAKDLDGVPDTPQAFLTDGTQAINFHRNTWHGVLTPLSGSGLFAVIDRIGTTPNLQEYWLPTQYVVVN
ncbi:MAG: ureidoglycolate lyase [Rhodobacteraceae bacterium]|nr:ureidoglycolate lyase [Paracoccaceae bacterium]